MEIKALETESYLQLNIRGVLDTANSRELEEFIEKKIGQGYRKFLLDLAQVETLSSGGIGFFIRIFEKSKMVPRVHFAILHCNQEIARLFRFFSLDKKLPIFQNVEKARQWIQSISLPSPREQKQEKEETPIEPKQSYEKGIRFYYKGERDPESYAYRRGLWKLRETQPPVSQMEPVEPSSSPQPIKPTSGEPQNQKSQELNFLSRLEEKMEALRKELTDQNQKFQEGIFQAIEKKIQESIETHPPIQEIQTFPANGVEPEIIQCEVCGVMLRLGKFGKYQCPCCNTEFYYKKSKSISYLEKLA